MELLNRLFYLTIIVPFICLLLLVDFVKVLLVSLVAGMSEPPYGVPSAEWNSWQTGEEEAALWLRQQALKAALGYALFGGEEP